MFETLADLILQPGTRDGTAPALRHKSQTTTYVELGDAVRAFAAGAIASGLERNDRVAVFAGKQPETVVAAFGASLAGGVFVPVNTLLKPPQVAYILKDCNVRMLVTTESRLGDLRDVLGDCPDLRTVVLVDGAEAGELPGNQALVPWERITQVPATAPLPRLVASDMAAIMYTSGSTGMPKGVVLSHANMVVGALSVAAYIGNAADDRILAALPLSFDAGLSQLTTAFSAGACVVLHDYLLPQDIVRIVEREQVTGITGVPPLWMQLAEQKWPDAARRTLRYFANTGGKMPRETLARLREIFPSAKPFLMYGLTEAFRSTYLPPGQVDERPDSIGKAIPNVEVMVVREDGSLCGPGEVGELVHRGPLVSLGYWNDPERTAKRFRPAPGRPEGIPLTEMAVYSGDSVRMDEDGYLYFVGRMDDMIKTSGYRVSPAEVEEVVYDSGLVSEVAALGIAHPRLGHGIVLVAKAREAGQEPTDALLAHLRPQVPNYMVPQAVFWRDTLPRNANGKLDRKTLTAELADLFQEKSA